MVRYVALWAAQALTTDEQVLVRLVYCRVDDRLHPIESSITLLGHAGQRFIPYIVAGINDIRGRKLWQGVPVLSRV